MTFDTLTISFLIITGIVFAVMFIHRKEIFAFDPHGMIKHTARRPYHKVSNR